MSRSNKWRQFVKDPDRKSIPRIGYELVRMGIAHRELPFHYFSRLLYRKSRENYLDYISNKRIVKLHHSTELHSRATIDILSNKLLFRHYFNGTGVETPVVLGYSVKKRFVDESTGDAMDLSENPQAVFKNVLDSAKTDTVFIKPLNGVGGKSAFKVSAADLEDQSAIEEMARVIRKGAFIYQETLEQHPAMNEIYPHSINTIRMDTFIEDDGSVEVISGFIRFGHGGNFVDNIGTSGGCFVTIDFETGRLRKEGLQLLEHGARRFDAHPNTGFVFEGFEVPYLEEAKALVRKAAQLLGDRLVGWDVAITPDGPVLLEGNQDYHIAMSDIAYGGFGSHPVYKRILNEFV